MIIFKLYKKPQAFMKPMKCGFNYLG